MNRRNLLKTVATASLLPLADFVRSADAVILMKGIPSTGKQVPVIGMGTFKVFEIGGDMALRDQHTEVMRTFFDMGGGMIDSSPMYTVAEDVIGYALEKIGHPQGLISSTKVWNTTSDRSRVQFEKSLQSWDVDAFDIFMVHNVDVWQEHVDTVKSYKESREIRYLGISTSHGREATELERLMETEPLDFVQLTYNILDRTVEDRLLPLAQERGIAIMANRPFQGGELFKHIANQPLPAWSAEIDCSNWAQILLKYVVSHPAVTCAIPGTSQVPHMVENMGALTGVLPDPGMRETMRQHFEALI
jgi:diketogulonate reductase-like aldo/keto reductase